MEIGSKVIIKRKICANGLRNPHFNKVATVLSIDRIDQVCVSIDSFPNCNHREFYNRFWYNSDELEPIEVLGKEVPLKDKKFTV